MIRSLIVALLLFLAESLPDLHLPSHILPTSGGKINRKQTMEAMVFDYVQLPDVHQAIIIGIFGGVLSFVSFVKYIKESSYVPCYMEEMARSC